MKDFSNASFAPNAIALMKVALDAAVASLPEPVSSVHVQCFAETILRSAKEGERDSGAEKNSAGRITNLISLIDEPTWQATPPSGLASI